jgi:hypothetical protein
VSDEDSAEEIDDDCKLLNGDVSEGGAGSEETAAPKKKVREGGSWKGGRCRAWCTKLPSYWGCA